MKFEFKLPDLGEGLTDGEIVKWHVKEGDTVTENQLLANILTDKAEVEIPSPKAGKITKLMGKEGEKILVHATLVEFELAGNGASAAAAPAPASGNTSRYEFKLPDLGEGLTDGEIVKWHVKEGDTVTENQLLANILTDKAEVEIPSPKAGKIIKLMGKEGEKILVHATLVEFELAGGGTAAAPVAAPKTAAAAATTAVPAKRAPGVNAMPAVRKLAAELKVDLAGITGTGPGGRITVDDVKKASGSTTTASSPERGDEELVPFIGIRRKTAEKMAESYRTVAHVTHMDEADFTALVALRAELKPEAEKKGVKLSYLPFIIKAITKSLVEYPNLNAVLDEKGGSIIRKKYYNVGIAVATETSLVVPNIKDADSKDIWALAGELNSLAKTSREGKIDVSALKGGTFTITNIGPIGGLFATPIVNYPEVGILGIMKLQKRPVVRDGAVVVRDMTNLVLSFDHRVLDGAEAAHFMNTLIKHLENPRTLV